MKQLILLSIFLSLIYSLNAQDKTPGNSTNQLPHTQIGCKIGYLHSTVYGSQVDSYSAFDGEFIPRKSISLGVQAKSTILRWWYLKFEINLLQKGAKMEESNFVYPPRPYFTYLNIPVITGLRLQLIPNTFSIGLEFGAASNIEISNQENLDQGLYPTIYPSYDKHIIELNYGLDFEFILNEKLSFSTNLRGFKDLDAFFQRIDHYNPYSGADEDIEFHVSEMKHKGLNLNFALNYTINN